MGPPESRVCLPPPLPHEHGAWMMLYTPLTAVLIAVLPVEDKSLERRDKRVGNSMPEIWVLQHAACETLGTIADVLKASGISWQYVQTFQGASVPRGMDGASGLIVMGGPMGVYDYGQYPFLLEEIRLIEQALKEDKPVLGVCLGCQLLAATLGAPVTPGRQKEIGWHPVHLTDLAIADRLWGGARPSFMAYHWHGDVFDLPEGASPLASSDLTACQAFRCGPKAYGFLFHMEVTRRIIEGMVETFGDELAEAEVNGGKIIGNAGGYLPQLQEIGGRVFQRWARLVTI